MINSRAARMHSAEENPLLAARRLVVISPHLDDAVMSVGGTIARAVRAGVKVEVLTVFGYVPLSETPAGPLGLQVGIRHRGRRRTHPPPGGRGGLPHLGRDAAPTRFRGGAL